jgi:hypothetical protein
MKNNKIYTSSMDITFLLNSELNDLPVELQERITSFLLKLDERQRSLEQSQETRLSRHG